MTNARLRPAVLISILVAVLGVCALLLTPAKAETFDYWSLWEVENGEWVPTDVGASDLEVQNESVIAAKYVRTEATPTASDAPSQSTSYADLCSDSTSDSSGLDVAVVLDYGDPDLNPSEEATPKAVVECVTVPSPGTGAAALSAAATVTADQAGFISAINSYPASVPTESAAVPAANEPLNEDIETSAPGLSLIWLLLIIGFVVLVIAVAVALYRRNRQSSSDWDDTPSA